MLVDGLMRCLLDQPALQASTNHQLCCIAPAACDCAGASPGQQGLLQLPDISGSEPSMPLFYDTSQLLGDGCSGRVYGAGCYEDMLQGQAVLAVKVCYTLTVGHSLCCTAFRPPKADGDIALGQASLFAALKT